MRIKKMCALMLALMGFVLVLASPATASTSGTLGQLPGTDGCMMQDPLEDPDEGCAEGRALGDHLNALAASPDGAYVYAANGEFGGEGGGVNVFRRGAGGELIQLDGTDACIGETDEADMCTEGRALGAARDLAMSPDGKQLYVATPDGIAVLDRDADNGTLSQEPYDDPETAELDENTRGCVSMDSEELCAPARALEDVTGIVISPDGKFVYTTSVGDSTDVNAVAIFSRGEDGGLTQEGCISDDGGDGDGGQCDDARYMFEPNDLAISNDGRNIYVAVSEARPDDWNVAVEHGPGAVVVLDRDLEDGSLQQDADPSGCMARYSGFSEEFRNDHYECRPAFGLMDAIQIQVSPDDKGVAVVSQGDWTEAYPGALTVFSRDAGGNLTQTGCVSRDGDDGEPDSEPWVDADVCTVADGMTEPSGLAFSGDGRNLYVAAEDDSSIVALSRDPATGAVEQLPGQDGCLSDEVPTPFGDAVTCADGRALMEVTKVLVVGCSVYSIARGDTNFTDAQGNEGSINAYGRCNPVSSTSAGTCSTTGVIPIAVADGNGGTGAKRVHYRVDGGAEQVGVTGDGNPGVLAVQLAPGRHTVEFWGEDTKGLVEDVRRQVVVNVDPSTADGCAAAAPAAAVRTVPQTNAPSQTPPPRRCESRRALSLRISKRAMRGRQIQSVRARARGMSTRRLLVTRRGRVVRVSADLRGLDPRTVQVRIKVRFTDGSTTTEVRRFRTCVPQQ